MSAPSINPIQAPQAASGRDLKQDRAIRTQAQILNAAAEAFAEQGFLAVTVADLAEKAGVTKGAVYFHYANKDALAVAVTEEFYRRIATLTDETPPARTKHLDVLVALLLRTAKAFRDDVVIQAGAQLQLEHKLIKVPLPAPFVGFTQTVQSILERARADRELLASADPGHLARVIAAAFYGSQHISWVTNNRGDIMERTRELIEVTLSHLRQVRRL